MPLYSYSGNLSVSHCGAKISCRLSLFVPVLQTCMSTFAGAENPGVCLRR
jgi:hypothetical protein